MPQPDCSAIISGHSGRVAKTPQAKVYTATDITDEHRAEFVKLNVFEDGDMLIILNGLDYLAEIGYMAYINSKVNHAK